MNFTETKSIYHQICDTISEQIIQGEYSSGDRIPSVRELAAKLEVNQNTAMRSYSELQRDGIISNKRGVGFFVAEDAKDKILEVRREEFISTTLPEFVKQIKLLSPSKKDLEPIINLINKM